MEPTLNGANHRTYQNAQGIDVTKHNPWRAPGHAPIASPCGLAGGWYTPGMPGFGGIPPLGIAQGMDGRDLPMLPGKRTKWKAGSAQEVAWSIHANHGGGYAYRLCPKADVRNLSESCFQSYHLPFVDETSWIQFGADRSNRSAIPAVRVSSGTNPLNSVWTRNPIPACSGPFGGSLMTPGCDKPQFEPPLPGLFGFGVGRCDSGLPNLTCTPQEEQYWHKKFNFAIVDLVQVPMDLPPGDYVLSFRWEGEQSPQIWAQCADVTITPPDVDSYSLKVLVCMLIVAAGVSVAVGAGVVISLKRARAAWEMALVGRPVLRRPDMKACVCALLFLFVAGSLVAGFTRTDALRNVSDFMEEDASNPQVIETPPGCEFEPTAKYNPKSGPYPYGWRPAGGVVDGQGCCDGECECHLCDCEDADLRSSSLFAKVNWGPYFVFTPFTPCSPYWGGALIFEPRGYNGRIILPLLLACCILFPILAVLNRVRCVRRWAGKRLCAPYQGNRCIFANLFYVLEFKRGELVMLAWVGCILAAVFAYIWERNRINNLVGLRALGGISIMCMSLLTFPVTRHSVLLPMLHISFDRAIKFHRILGYVMYICVTVHGINEVQDLMVVYMRGDPLVVPDDHPPGGAVRESQGRYFINQMEWPAALGKALHRGLFQWSVSAPDGPPLAGTIAWVAMMIMFIVGSMRRKHWEAFVCSHMCYLVVFVMTCIHYPTALVLCTPGVLFYSLDVALRYWTSRGGKYDGAIKSAQYFAEAGVTKLVVVPGPNFNGNGAGRFLTIEIPVLDRGQRVGETHPFTISWTNPDQSVTLHIKDFGYSDIAPSWTGRLGVAAMDGTVAEGTVAFVDGPFGRLSPPLGGHRAVFLIGGGIGVTPMFHILQKILQEPANLPPASRVVFCWTVRSWTLLVPFSEELAALEALRKSADTTIQVSMLIYETMKNVLSAAALEAGTTGGNASLNHGSSGNRGSSANHGSSGGISLLDSSQAVMSTLVSEDHPLSGFTPIPSMLASSLCTFSDGPRPMDLPAVDHGRPNFAELIRCADGESPDDIAVYVCGPPSMVAECQKHCYRQSFVCHEETFLF